MRSNLERSGQTKFYIITSTAQRLFAAAGPAAAREQRYVRRGLDDFVRQREKRRWSPLLRIELEMFMAPEAEERKTEAAVQPRSENDTAKIRQSAALIVQPAPDPDSPPTAMYFSQLPKNHKQRCFPPKELSAELRVISSRKSSSLKVEPSQSILIKRAAFVPTCVNV